ncbi:uncharacterized protein I303_107805 [Kwoniella dejecticola CBS 10117]|uniref:Uncharacterized protein n=1 Tax=Kwoniella dejecticola CBS 10117 TaxID=1296121 RepID=A0AAJ8MIZ4_9TREE
MTIKKVEEQNRPKEYLRNVRLVHPNGDLSQATLVWRPKWRYANTSTNANANANAHDNTGTSTNLDGDKGEYPINFDNPNILDCSESTAHERHPSLSADTLTINQSQLYGKTELPTENFSTNLQEFARQCTTLQRNIDKEHRRLMFLSSASHKERDESITKDHILHNIVSSLLDDASMSFQFVKRTQFLSAADAFVEFRARVDTLAEEKQGESPHLDARRSGKLWVDQLEDSVNSRNALAELEMIRGIAGSIRAELDGTDGKVAVKEKIRALVMASVLAQTRASASRNRWKRHLRDSTDQTLNCRGTTMSWRRSGLTPA